MRCKAGIQQAILPAAFVLLFASTAQAAAELKDRPVSLSTPSSSNASSADPPAIEPLDPNAPPVEPRKKRKKGVPLTPDAPPVAPESEVPLDPNAPPIAPETAVPLDPNAPLVAPEKYVAFDPNAPPRAHIPIGPDLYFGGFASLRAFADRNKSVNTQPNDANSQFSPSVSLAFAYDPNRYIHVFTNVNFGKSTAFEETRDTTQTVDLTLKQAYLALNNVIEGTSLQIGRQRFRDVRRWLFNDTLDAARLAYKSETLSMEFSASKLNIFQSELLGPDPNPSGETGKFINYYSSMSYKLDRKSRIGAFALYQKGDTQYPMFFGIQSEGELVRHLNYWIQSAMVRGTDSSRRIRGEAVDVGLTQVFGARTSIRPSITVGYAYGSGDGDRNDSVDTAFRQTGFQDNSDSYSGVARFKYYGEVLDPQLTNLMIFTGGAGIKPSLRSSLDVVYHYYLRDFSSTSIPRAGLNFVGQTGTDKHLGEEIDLIIGYQEIAHVTTRLIFGVFMPGKAFAEPVRAGARDPAFSASILIRYFF
jgi:alginate production protein